MHDDIAGVLLAGGLSRRMGGGNKGLLSLSGKPLVARAADALRPQVSRLILNANGVPARFADFELPIISDETQDFAGPLAGILAALRWARTNAPGVRAVVSVPADAPFIPNDLVDRLRDAADGRAAVAVSRGRRHNVVALWPLTVMNDIEAALARGERKVQTIIGSLAARPVEFSDVEIRGRRVDPFFNINTPDDLARAEAVLNSPPFVVGIAGWKNSGKTTLVEKLVRDLTARGFQVSTIKHSHHAIGGEQGATDSSRHRRAGAVQVGLVGINGWGLVSGDGAMDWHDGPAPSLDEMIARLSASDMIIVEGFKSAPILKIEVRRIGQGDGPPLIDCDPTVFAIASDRPIAAAGVTVFDLDDIAGLTDALLELRRRTGGEP